MADIHILPDRFSYDFQRKNGSFVLRYREWHVALGEQAFKKVFENVKTRYRSSPILKELNISLKREIKERMIEVYWVTDNRFAPLNIVSEILAQVIEDDRDVTIASNFLQNIVKAVAREKNLKLT